MVDGVKLVSTLYNTGEIRVAELFISPVSPGSNHYHSIVNELCICLEGQMLVHQHGMPSLRLLPGQQTTIAAGVIHQVENRQAVPCRYMVIQGPGKYDLIRTPSAAD